MPSPNTEPATTEDPRIVHLRDAIRIAYLEERTEHDRRRLAAGKVSAQQLADGSKDDDPHDMSALTAGLAARLSAVTDAEATRMYEQSQKAVGALVGDSERGVTTLFSPVARTIVAPLDTVMTRRQLTVAASAAVSGAAAGGAGLVGSKLPVSKWAAAFPYTAALKSKALRQSEGGWRALWKGNGLNAAAGLARYMSLGWVLGAAERGRWFGEHADLSSPKVVPSAAHVAYVAAAYAGSRALAYPLEVARTLRQADPWVRGQPYAPFTAGAVAKSAFPSALDTLRNSLHFRGVLPAVASEAMLGAALAMCFGQVQPWVEAQSARTATGQPVAGGADPNVPAPSTPLLAGTAVAMAITYPLETLSKRMRVAGTGPFPAHRSYQELYAATGGWRGQYRGMALYVAKVVPLSVVIGGLFTAYWIGARQKTTKLMDSLDFNLLTRTWDQEYREMISAQLRAVELHFQNDAGRAEPELPRATGSSGSGSGSSSGSSGRK